MWCVAIGSSDLFEAWESSSWPTTTGIVVRSQVDTGTGKKGGVTCTLNLAYTYQVNGKTFNADGYTGVSPGMWVNNQSASYGLINAFPVGKHPVVFYSATQPEHSYLLPGVHEFNFMWFLVGTLCLIIGSVFGLVIFWVPRHPWTDDLGRETTDPNQGTVTPLVVGTFMFAGLLFFLNIMALLWLLGLRF